MTTENKPDVYKELADTVAKDISSANSDGSLSSRTVAKNATLGAGYGTDKVGGAAPVQVNGYGELERILKLAYNQAATGKGKERHAYTPIGFRPWEQQPIMEIGRMVGPGGHAYQVGKKAQEAVGMASRGDFQAAKNEVLGALVYAAAMYKILEEQQAAQV